MLFTKKSSENKCKQKDIYLILLPMIFGICLCFACLIGSTFAWFSASQSAGTQNVHAANYNISIKVELDGEEIAEASGEYSLTAEKTYTVTITAVGDATNGYAIISFDNVLWKHTIPIAVGESFTFKLEIKENAVMNASAQWGTSSKDEADKITDSDKPYAYSGTENNDSGEN